MTVNESTQTNGLPGKKEPNAGPLNKTEMESKPWSVESVLSAIDPSYDADTTSPIPFMNLLERLKITRRAGWLRFGIEECESIAEHMYRMGVLTMLAPQSITSKVDVGRCTQMALVHDMAESLVGDITPVDGVSKEEKSRRESETMDYICNDLLGRYNSGLNGKHMRELWQEYEDSETENSKFVHDIDKVELIQQMFEYEQKFKCEKDLGEFTWVATRIKSKEVKAWSDHILWKRKQLWGKAGKKPTWNGVPEPQSEPTPP